MFRTYFGVLGFTKYYVVYIFKAVFTIWKIIRIYTFLNRNIISNSII